MMKSKIIGMAMIMLGMVSLSALPAQPTYAACNNHFLTFPTWFRGLPMDASCNIKAPAKTKDSSGLTKFLLTIVLNILETMIQLVSYIAVGFIIWGGFLYLTSGGSSDVIVRGRKMIINAVIGLVLSLLAVIITSYIVGTLS